MDNLVENIKRSEGFRGDVYEDHLGFATVGYGTKMPISEAEAELLLKRRLEIAVDALLEKKGFIAELSEQRQEVLYEMVYQLGVNGLLKFKKMFAAIEAGDFERASKEMLDSKWAKQTPNRAQRLAAIMQG